MPRRAQPTDEAPYVACRLFHHPGGVALPGQSLSLTPELAERAIRNGDVRPAERPAAPQSTVQPSTEEIA